MRHFEMLDQMMIDEASGIVTLRVQQAHEEHPQLALRREGVYIAISARYGPMEIALRPRYEELVRLLNRLQPVEGLQTTRQVGTSQAYLAIGLRNDGTLILRPTIVADATGHFTFNLAVNPAVTKRFFEWVPTDS